MFFDDTFDSKATPTTIPTELAERAEALAQELSSHSGVRPVVMGTFAMELATEWHHRRIPLDGDGAPIVLLPRLGRWLVTKLGESDAIFVFSGRESAVVRARALAAEQGVAFFALGPAGAVTDRVPAARTWSVDDEELTSADGASVMPEAPEPTPALEIRIEKHGRRYAILIDDTVVATAANKQRALRKADVLRKDPDLASVAQGAKAADSGAATAEGV